MLELENNKLNKFLGLPTDEVIVIYGEPASGKTTLALQASLAVAKKGKVIFIDTEGTFSVIRLKQMDANCEMLLNNIKLFSPKSFEEQERIILSLPFNVDLVVVDSLSKYYRDAVKGNALEINERMIGMLRRLHKFIDRNIPVIITNQVYSTMTGGINVVGGKMLLRWSQFLLKLENKPRKMIVEKPLKKEIWFKIENEGIILQ